MTRRPIVWACPPDKMGDYLADINTVPREFREPQPTPPGLRTMARGWLSRAMRMRPIGDVPDTALDPDLRRRIAEASRKDTVRWVNTLR